MTSSHTGQPFPGSGSSSGAFAFPALPVLSHRPETVVNPEGRRSESEPPPASQPTSSVWQRLFPASLGSSDESLDEPLPSPAGFELGHFVLKERIGIGGMGAVFRAEDTRLQREVALKVLGPAQSRDESSVKRFQNEASAAARLDHDNIARVYYIGEDHGLHFIAFEYITGTNLRDLIREGGPMTPADAVNYTIQIAGALNHTYAAGVVHRDIKPSNIIITPAARAKLVDLGLARKQNSESANELTLAGTTLGTFDYISPEQAKDPRTADVRSDIYSLGCTLYHALTGLPPYPEGTVLQKLLDHQGKEAPDPALKNRHVPPDLSAICQKMMASDPKQRYATPEQLMRDLMPVAGRLGLRGLPADGLIWRHIAPPKVTFWERNLGWVASLSVLLLIVFVVWRFPSLGTGPSLASVDDPNRPGRMKLTAENSPSSPLENWPAGDSENPNSTSPPAASSIKAPVPPDIQTPSPTEPEKNSTRDSPMTVGPGESQATADGVKPPFNMKSVLDPRDDDDPDSDFPSEPPQTSAKTPGLVNHNSEPKPASPPDQVASGSAPTVDPMENVETRPYVIINSDSSQGETKRTLEAACTAAQDGQIVEIHHDGLLPDVLNKPIRIKNKSLTIRAGEGHRPLLHFAGIGTPAEGLTTRLFQLSKASVDLINLDFQLAPPAGADASQTWAIASLEGGGRMLLQNVTVTVNAPDNHLASVVELLPAPASQMAKDMKMMMNQDSEPARTEFRVKIQNSFIRGACNVFLARHTLPGKIDVDGSAFAVEGSLLVAEGSLDMPAEGDHVELRLEHSTCLVGNSLIRMDSGDTPRDLVPLDVTNSQDNLIATNTNNNPLVSMTGSSEAEAFGSLLRWYGRKNFYDGFHVFWEASFRDPWNFEQWVNGWKNAEAAKGTKEEAALDGGFAWKVNWVGMEFSEITAGDLALDREALNNRAVDGATDGTDVGANLARLPKLPARTQAEP